MTIREKLELDKNLIIVRVRNGESLKSIGKSYHCSGVNIWYFLQNLGIQTNIVRSPLYGKKENYKAQIIDLFNEGKTCYEISKILNISKHSALRWARSFGLDTSKNYSGDPNNLLKDKKDQVIKLFKEGNSCDKIAEILEYSNSSIWHLLKREGCELSRTIYDVDEIFFQKLDTEQKCYSFGFILADGNIYKGLKGFRICIADTDIDILYKIKDILQYNGPLHYKKAKNSRCKPEVELSITRTKMAQDLNKLGCPQAKSLILKFPSFEIVPENLMRPLILGYFDGDGGICKSKRGTVSITGSYDFIYGLGKYLNSIGLQFTNIYQRYTNRPKEKSAHMLQFGRNADKIAFLKWIYQDATIFMDRKRNLSRQVYGI